MGFKIYPISASVLQFVFSFVAGLDAIGRVLSKARKEGMDSFGHSYKKSVEGEKHAPQV